MLRSNRLTHIVILILAALPASALGQLSSLNAFSPYTFYGIGDFGTQGPAYQRSMGGVGVAFSDPKRANYLNPASYSSVNPQSVLFSVGLQGGGVYAKTATQKSSQNLFNFSDVGLQLPLWGGKVGMGVNVTPMSSVGYRVKMYETDPYLLANVGSIRYDYLGDGNITQFKVGVGAKLFKGFSLGANFIYYHGSIERDFNTEITPTIGNPVQRIQTGTAASDYSAAWFNAGIRYELISKPTRILSVGATFSPRANLRPKVYREVYATNVYQDLVQDTSYRADYYLPANVTAGVFFRTTKWGAGLDYTFQKWTGLNADDATNNIKFTNSHYIKAGIEYTPNSMDVRSYLKRCTYRLGYRFNSYYMQINGQPIRDNAITFGVGAPLRQGLTNIDVGVELGMRGNTTVGTSGTKQFQMVQEKYFNIVVGLSLFGEDYWFTKHKYD